MVLGKGTEYLHSTDKVKGRTLATVNFLLEVFLQTSWESG